MTQSNLAAAVAAPSVCVPLMMCGASWASRGAASAGIAGTISAVPTYRSPLSSVFFRRGMRRLILPSNAAAARCTQPFGSAAPLCARFLRNATVSMAAERKSEHASTSGDTGAIDWSSGRTLNPECINDELVPCAIAQPCATAYALRRHAGLTVCQESQAAICNPHPLSLIIFRCCGRRHLWTKICFVCVSIAMRIHL